AQLADVDGRVAVQALQALQRLVPDSDSSLSPRARTLLLHPDAAVRSVAADLLARHAVVDDVDRLADAYLRAATDTFDDARLSAVAALAAIAATSADARTAVATRFLARVPRADDYLVCRLLLEKKKNAKKNELVNVNHTTESVTQHSRHIESACRTKQRYQ